MTTTNLSTILNRITRRQSLSNAEEQYLVRDLDEALRTLRRKLSPPWTLKKSTLKVFNDVLIYPIASDHAELAYLDSQKNESSYSNRARFKFTSLKEFYENPDYRNDLAEIWDANTKYLGVRYNPQGATGQIIESAEDATGWTGSGDAGTPVKNTVVFKKGNASIKIPITNSAGTATVEVDITSFSDTEYKRKYFFVWVYLNSAPTSISLRLGNDSSNYLGATVTTQFSGQSFKADDWNLLAFDLNEATETGTFDETIIDYQAIIFTGAATGTYYIDESNLRAWELLDYWYYSTFNVQTVSASVPDQDFFFNSSEIYSTDTKLIGDNEWVDVIMYDAMLISLTDQENEKVKEEITRRRQIAWGDLIGKYPSLEPVLITRYRRFEQDHTSPVRSNIY